MVITAIEWRATNGRTTRICGVSVRIRPPPSSPHPSNSEALFRHAIHRKLCADEWIAPLWIITESKERIRMNTTRVWLGTSIAAEADRGNEAAFLRFCQPTTKERAKQCIKFNLYQNRVLSVLRLGLLALINSVDFYNTAWILLYILWVTSTCTDFWWIGLDRVYSIRSTSFYIFIATTAATLIAEQERILSTSSISSVVLAISSL